MQIPVFTKDFLHSAVLVFHFCKPLFGFRNGRVGSQDVYEGLQHVFPSNLTHDEKLRKIGRILGIMSKEGLISKPLKARNGILQRKEKVNLELSCTAICCRVRLFMVVLPVIFGYSLTARCLLFKLWIKKSITLHDYALTAKLKKSFV